jgi:uncharacterized protein (TIRG00374 family)
MENRSSQWERGLILSIVVAVAIYLGTVLWSGADRVWLALKSLPVWLVPSLLALIFVGYCLRFVRWQWYLRSMGYRVPAASSFRIFLASFALTASPGKAGESIKSLMLKRQHQIPIAPTLAGLFCERFTDALSVVLLICLGLSSLAHLQWGILAVGALQLAFILMLQNPKFLAQRILHPISNWAKRRSIGILVKITRKFEDLIESASTLLKPGLLLGGTFLALVAWGLEGIALYWLFQHLGATSITLYQAVLIHTASGLIGALSMLPGGIGGAEAMTISLSLLYGASQTHAVAATLLIRLMTLWYAVFIGILVLLWEGNRRQAKGNREQGTGDSEEES